MLQALPKDHLRHPIQFLGESIDAIDGQSLRAIPLDNGRERSHTAVFIFGEIQRGIPVVAAKGTAAWIDEEGAYPESDDTFGLVSIGACKV